MQNLEQPIAITSEMEQATIRMREILVDRTAFYAQHFARPRSATKCRCAAHNDTTASTRFELLPNEIQQHIYDLASTETEADLGWDWTADDVAVLESPAQETMGNLLRVSCSVGQNLVAVICAKGARDWKRYEDLDWALHWFLRREDGRQWIGNAGEGELLIDKMRGKPAKKAE